MGEKIKIFIRRASLFMLCMVFISCSIMRVSAEDKLYEGHTSDEWQSYIQDFFSTYILSMDPTTLYDAVDFYRQNNMESVADMYEYWIEKQPTLGDFVAFGDFSIDDEQGFISAVQVVTFENGKIEFEMIQDVNTDDPVLHLRDHVEASRDLGQVMSKAAMNTLMGVGTVFVVLAVMIILISLFKYVNLIEKSMQKKDEDNGLAAPDFVEQIAERETNSAAAVTSDTELIAVIAAAIAAATGDDTDSFVVRSIKRRF